MIAAILIGRAGSSGFPGKNLHEIDGIPMAAYPLRAAKAVEEIDALYVSTDSPGIADIGREYGATIIDRPDYLCTNEALGEHAYQHAHQVIRDALAAEGREPEIYVLLMANAPTIHPNHLREGIRVLRENPSYDSAVTVSRYNMWSPLRARKVNDEGLLDPFVPFETFGDPKTLNCDRDSQGDVMFADMSASIIRPRNLDDLESGLLPQQWMGQRIYPIRNEAGLDLDYPWQMGQVEWWLSNFDQA